MSETIEIPLTQGKIALVDASDAPSLLAAKWHAIRNCRTFYASRSETTDGRRRIIAMHRTILGATADGLVIDHINGDGLDNRRINLRVCTTKQNARNRRAKTEQWSSRYRGVYKKKTASGAWVAHITVDYEHLLVGKFESEAEAARAYDRAAIVSFGEFATLNFPIADYANEPPWSGALKRAPPRTGLRGVIQRLDKWQARIGSNGRDIFLGSFDSPEAAARAYDKAAREFRGEKARCNFPEEK